MEGGILGLDMKRWGLKQGTYTPICKDKYVGKSLPIFRSGWECKAFIQLDRNPKIIKWGSQSVIIPYMDSTRGKETHRYIVDLFFVTMNQQGQEQKWLIEIKPYNQSVPPKPSKRKSPARIIQQGIVYQRNHDKWEAAITFCKKRGWHFAVWTEKGINKLV